ncbi:MAG: tRNA 2-selenouridine(34) synthase MnmH [Chitinophagaceae bacterium]
MAIQKINIDQFLSLAKEYPILDVRSPGEYFHAHIPAAISFPLFSDEERKMVGTSFKQESRAQAIKIGLDFFGPKMRKMVEEAEKIISNRQLAISNEQQTINNGQSATYNNENPLPIANCLLIHCWRGGMRSAAIAWLLDLYGFKVYTLIGGYKKYRNYVLDTFKIPIDLKIVGGYTGSGKTSILKSLKEKGESVVDLEGLASHKGSAFGNIGLPKQPGQEMFENLLATEFRKVANSAKTASSEAPFRAGPDFSGGFGGIWLEDESQRIGLINIPKDLWDQMRQSPVYFLDIPFEERLKQIVLEYGDLDQEMMTDAIGRISQKLGNLNAKTAILLLNEGKKAESFDILLKYYDKQYFKSLHNRKEINSLLHTIQCKSVTPENANQLVRLSQLQQQSP